MLLYLLISGDLLYCGLAAVALGALAERWRWRLGVGLVWGGMVLALASAVPFHPSVYAGLLAAGAAWQASRARGAGTQRLGAVLLLTVVAMVCGWGVAARGGSSAPLPAGPTVYVLGDSLSAGVGPTTEGTWPRLLSAQRNLEVSTLAKPGATLASGVEQAHAIPERPAVVLIELGGNDLLGGTSPTQFAANLRSLLAAVATRERRVVMFELPLLPLQNEYGRIQRRACREHGVALLPRSILAGAIALPGHSSDGLHLSAEGHSWLARRVGRLWPEET